MAEISKKAKVSRLAAIVTAAVMLLADIFTKQLVLNTLGNEGYAANVPFIKGVVSFTFRTNNGAGFSILEGKTLFLVIFTVIAMAFIVYLFATRKIGGCLTDWGYCLVLSGGIGNLIDRVFRDGNVIDFICLDFIDFPVFNVADICVTVGAALVLLYFVIDIIRDSKKKKENV